MELINGHDLKMSFGTATRCLERYRDVINALNVFPVPDGDTGTNMLLTLRAGMDQCDHASDATVSAVLQQLANGTFWGARGNSGVILSQFFKGFAAALESKITCSSPDLVLAFQRATDAAYQAVGSPVEGTMLSVIRAVSEAVQKITSPDVVSVWEEAFASAKAALAQTPLQLPVLQEAGVVDAGGLGMVAIVGGAWCYLSGQELENTDLGIEGLVLGPAGLSAAGAPTVTREFLDSTHDPQWGYCTQFLIAGEGLEPDQLRQRFNNMASSVAVVGDSQHIRVHVHAQDPGPALSYGVSLGQLSQIEIQNMDLQNQGWATGHGSRKTARSGTAVVAVAPGEGLAQLFSQAGCLAVIRGGQTMNPSVQQIIEAAEQSGGQEVIILPNNKNVVAAADRAARSGSGGSLHVVPTETVPQGVAALLAFNPEETLEHNLKRMRAALSEVISIEVTRAVRDTRVEGLPVRAGQYIALVDGELTVAEATAEAALCSALTRAGLSDDKVVTLYWGSDSSQEQAQSVASDLGNLVPGIQVDVVYGGQPHYPYLASIE